MLERAARSLRPGHGKTVVNTLWQDFNYMFPQDVWNSEKGDAFQKLIARFCHHGEKDCPICGSDTEPRDGKYGKFHGCSKYPDCKGVRKENGDPSINQALREYLSGQIRLHGVEEHEVPDRFTDLEL